jgi:hypothetical protein
MLGASTAIHFGPVVFSLLPSGLEVRDVEGEVGIPIDLLEGEAAEPPPPPRPPPPPPEEPSAGEKDPHGNTPTTAGLDAGKPHDAGPKDAGPRDAADAGDAGDAGDSGAEGGALLAENGDASTDASFPDGAVASLGDAGAEAGTGGTGPRDPSAVLGAVGAVQADVVLVMLVVNNEVIRTHPIGARLGPMLRAIPQWDEFMAGTPINPVRDTDWLTISGPSLINTQKDVIMIHYSAPDSTVEKAVDIVASKYDQGGGYDAGVPGVKGWLGHADRGQRVFLRPPQPRVLAVVPPSAAHKVAATLKAAKVPDHVLGGKEAVRLRLSNPHRPIPDIPETVTELRLWAVPRADEGLDVYLDGDCADEGAASEAAEALTKTIARKNTFAVRFATNNLLGNAEVKSEGKLIKAHLVASRDQLEAVLGVVAAFLNVDIATPTTPPPKPRPSPQPPTAASSKASGTPRAKP